MKTLRYLGIVLIVLSAALVGAQPVPNDNSDTQPVAAKRTNPGSPAPETITTGAGSLDSLGVTPTDVDAPYEGGTRRIHLESSVFRREDPVVYSADGRRDPFRALISDRSGNQDIKTDLLVVDGADLTGVVWTEGQYVAMVKDKDKSKPTFFLRQGDAVYRGRVVSVSQTHIVCELSGFGEYRQVTLKVNDSK